MNSGAEKGSEGKKNNRSRRKVITSRGNKPDQSSQETAGPSPRREGAHAHKLVHTAAERTENIAASRSQFRFWAASVKWSTRRETRVFAASAVWRQGARKRAGVTAAEGTTP
ncbi:hypothetical protein GCM10017673_09320 [Streptosporangium violaceochromogenes]|nr:hypothetical protein GCM10017673_09320 [Streptosporangium violaceochromogenes]